MGECICRVWLIALNRINSWVTEKWVFNVSFFPLARLVLRYHVMALMQSGIIRAMDKNCSSHHTNVWRYNQEICVIKRHLWHSRLPQLVATEICVFFFFVDFSHFTRPNIPHVVINQMLPFESKLEFVKVLIRRSQKWNISWNIKPSNCEHFWVVANKRYKFACTMAVWCSTFVCC